MRTRVEELGSQSRHVAADEYILPGDEHVVKDDEGIGFIKPASPGYPAEERVKLFKLAWDVVGSEFAGHHHQYEMFYAGAPFVAKGYAYRNYGYDDAVRRVDEFLASYDLESAANEEN